MNKPPTVLVVEDDPAVCSMVIEFLQRDGFLAYPAKTKREAVEALSSSLRPSAIILDINLPNGRGVDVAREVLAAAGPRPPVFINTGEFDRGWAEQFYKLAKGQLQGFWVKGTYKPSLIPQMVKDGMLRHALQHEVVRNECAAAVRKAAPRTGETLPSTMVRKVAVGVSRLSTVEKIAPFAIVAITALGTAIGEMAGWELDAVTTGVVGKLLLALGTGWYGARMGIRKGD